MERRLEHLLGYSEVIIERSLRKTLPLGFYLHQVIADGARLGMWTDKFDRVCVGEIIQTNPTTESMAAIFLNQQSNIQALKDLSNNPYRMAERLGHLSDYFLEMAESEEQIYNLETQDRKSLFFFPDPDKLLKTLLKDGSRPPLYLWYQLNPQQIDNLAATITRYLPNSEMHPPLAFAGFRLYSDNRLLLTPFDSQPISLSPEETQLLEILMANAPSTVTHGLIKEKFEDTCMVSSQGIRAYIKHLRNKLGDREIGSVRNHLIIQTLHRLGYSFDPDMDRLFKQRGVAIAL